nr:hypothetical protein [Tanacetum cinerariifolium]
VVKRSGDVTRLQALVDKKKIVISKDAIREILRLDDAEGVVCLPNEEIFAGLAQMGYEKPSTKLTFYKAFFSMICLSKGQRFNFSRYIFYSLVRNIDSSSKFYMYPRFIQLIIQAQVVDLSSHTTRYISPALTQKVFANMRRVGKGCSGVETPLFENMLQVREVVAEEEVQVPAHDDVDQENVIEEIADDVAPSTSPLPPSPIIPSLPLHQSPRASPSQATEGSSILIQQVFDKCSALVLRVEGLDIPIPAAEPVVAAVSTPISAAKPKSINETPSQKAAKRRRLREQAKEDENLKKQLEVVVDEDDDVFVEATPIGTKVPVANYEIVMLNNKPRSKIFRADDTHQLYTSFITLLKNFNREDLEDLWKIVKARFSTSKPTNFTDDYLLATLKNMFEKTDVQDVIWRSQQTEHRQALVKSWKLLTLCGVHIITFTTTKFVLLVEKKYPLSRPKENTKCVSAAGEEHTATKHKLKLLV